MADNFVTNLGTGGPTFRAVDKGGVLRSVIQIDAGGGGAEQLIQGSVTNGLDVDLTRTPKASGSGGGVIVIPSGLSTLVLAAADPLVLKMREIQNPTDATVYLKWGSGASPSSFHRRLLPNAEWWSETYYGLIHAYQFSGADIELAVTEFS